MKILILQLRRLGDVLMTTPMLRAIKTALPGAITHICVESSSAPAVRSNPHVDRVVIAERGVSFRLVRTLRREHYDVVIDALCTPGSARLAFLSSAPVRIGQARPWRRMFYTRRVPLRRESCYSALEKLALLEPIGIRTTDCQIELFPTADECREADRYWSALDIARTTPVVAFSPVSRRRRKAWAPERFAGVCDRWAERAGLRYLPLFGPGEEPLVEQVVARVRQRGAMLYPCPVLSFGALVPLVKRCAFYFGNDNGIRHAAIAAGIPSAAIFGLPDPVSWTPPEPACHFWVGGRRPIDSVTSDEVDAMMARLITACGLGPSSSHVTSRTLEPQRHDHT